MFQYLRMEILALEIWYYNFLMFLLLRLYIVYGFLRHYIIMVCSQELLVNQNLSGEILHQIHAMDMILLVNPALLEEIRCVLSVPVQGIQMGLTECTACQTSRYFLNGSCILCDPPLIRASTSSGLNGISLGYCISPCEPHEYVYPDGSCFDTCDPRFNSTTNYTAKFVILLVQQERLSTTKALVSRQLIAHTQRAWLIMVLWKYVSIIVQLELCYSDQQTHVSLLRIAKFLIKSI